MEKILVVDDEQGMRELLEIMLVREGYRVATAADATKALQRCRKEVFDLIITDLKMPKVDGLTFLREAKKICPGVMVILITAYASAETALAAMKEGVYDYLEKDFAIDDLKRIIRNALNNKGEKQKDLLFLKEVGQQVRFGEMIGKSSEMLKIYATIRKIAQTLTNILILGESGTGKELVARAIHDNSPRNGMPFVVINCGGIPENLLESELFGYCKGAFTGAFTDKQGLFEFARGGTIFLDEVAELSTFLQVKLLRVVQEKTFRRIGGSEDISVDVRIISATNKNLAEMVKAEKFREDLYYRLNVIPLFLPPLRERKEDIPVLSNYFIEKYSKELGKDVKTISTYAMELLLGYQFPGNIRELKNIIERSVALETSNIILPDNLILSDGIGGINSVTSSLGVADGAVNLNEELARCEKNLIEKALKQANGAKSKAADLLGITYDSLHYRCEKLGISPSMIKFA
ncbi:MAG: sigma-54 dependent transcriptional regulator [Syntrophobacterales bacterium]|nr:sigma-54 dependent transcriptional regulator [Syntrophobacterales bacterium]